MIIYQQISDVVHVVHQVDAQLRHIIEHVHLIVLIHRVNVVQIKKYRDVIMETGLVHHILTEVVLHQLAVEIELELHVQYVERLWRMEILEHVGIIHHLQVQLCVLQR